MRRVLLLLDWDDASNSQAFELYDSAERRFCVSLWFGIGQRYTVPAYRPLCKQRQIDLQERFFLRPRFDRSAHVQAFLFTGMRHDHL